MNVWLCQQSLEPKRLILSILHFQDISPDSLLPINAVRYLKYAIFKKQESSPVIHNLLITILASKWFLSDVPMLRFLDTAPVNMMSGKPLYDLDYALRQCILAWRMQPCVLICMWAVGVLTLEPGPEPDHNLISIRDTMQEAHLTNTDETETFLIHQPPFTMLLQKAGKSNVWDLVQG